ncbi:MAG: 50S ribosomal protein L4 [Chitinophagales bacterium]|jgi:large subunit ribosomal protein L4|nr:50S ribosomal protein L4 [Bacteroidota bacterium]MEC9222081.1 50S ribosomal protein L4 [Bacteroidota bacterium]
MKIEVKNIQGENAGRKVELPADIFGVEVNDHVLYLEVKRHLAELRQGTHKAKERGEIKGSTKKIRKQKGSGGARFGNIKNPLFRGGGTVFGPRPRKYGFKLNRKVMELALKSAYSQKAQEKAVVVVEDIAMDAAKTQEFAAILERLGCGAKALYVSPEVQENVALSSRNLPKASTMSLRDVTTYDVMNCQTLVLSESAIKEMVNN